MGMQTYLKITIGIILIVLLCMVQDTITTLIALFADVK